MFTGCNALLPNEIRPAEALPISPRNPRGANVGYAGNALDLEGGAVLTSAQFINVGCKVGEEKISLNTLIPVPADKEVDPDGMVIIQLLDNGGYTDVATTYEWHENCWNNQGEPVKTDITFDAGQGLWVYNYTWCDIGLRSSGEVQQTDIDYPLDLEGGAVGVINAYPTKVKLQDITPIADDVETDIDGMIVIQLLDNGGYTDVATTYEWHDGCWNNQGQPIDDKVAFDSGKGLWVYNYTWMGVHLHIPAPEL